MAMFERTGNKRADTQKINKVISQNLADINQKYTEIGRIVKLRCLDQVTDNEVLSLAADVDAKLFELRKLQDELNSINGIKVCPNCNATIDMNVMFCPSCGTPMAAPVAPAAVVPSTDHTAEFDPKDISDNKVYAMATYMLSVIGVVIAWDKDSNVFKIVSFAWAGFGAAFGPVMLLALFWKRSNKYGAIAGMVVGGAMIFIWKFVIAKLGGAFAIYELLPAFIIALVVNVVVSLITPAPEKEITDAFEEVKATK